jgi:hypothetical protein
MIGISLYDIEARVGVVLWFLIKRRYIRQTTGNGFPASKIQGG